MSNGLGMISNNLAEIVAKDKGIGNKILFLSISLSNLINIYLKVIISGPTHSIILELIFFDII